MPTHGQILDGSDVDGTRANARLGERVGDDAQPDGRMGLGERFNVEAQDFTSIAGVIGSVGFNVEDHGHLSEAFGLFVQIIPLLAGQLAALGKMTGDIGIEERAEVWHQVVPHARA